MFDYKNSLKLKPVVPLRVDNNNPLSVYLLPLEHVGVFIPTFVVYLIHPSIHPSIDIYHADSILRNLLLGAE